MGYRLDLGQAHQISSSGAPLSGAKLYVYNNTTTTPVALFSDEDVTSSAANPVVADSSGRFPYRFVASEGPHTYVLKTSADVTLWSADDIFAHPGAAAPLLALVDNPIINGDMNVWQRGTTFAAIASGAYSVDRFQYAASGAMVFTASRSTSVPSNAGRLLNYSLDFEVTTADTSIAAGDYASVLHKIEGYNFLSYAQRPFFIGFWVYATKTGTHCVYLRNDGSDRTYVAEYTVQASNTWQFISLLIPASPSAGTWNYTNSMGINIGWSLACGSTFQTPAGVWTVGDFRGSANQVNDCDTVGNRFRVTGIRLSLVPWPYNLAPTRTFGEELELCQRYFEKGGFGETVAPASAVSTIAYIAATWAANNASCQITLQTRKRVAPTITLYSGASGGTGSLAGLLVSGAWVNSATSVAERIENTSFGVAFTYVGLAYGDAHLANLGWTASAEL